MNPGIGPRSCRPNGCTEREAGHKGGQEEDKEVTFMEHLPQGIQMPGKDLRHLLKSSNQHDEGGTILVPILLMKRLRYKKGKQLAQGHKLLSLNS